ncbi:hypothetical protein [Micromonospora coerulea]|uniref:hypothetical protein n=1 Tax=Micromonospora coerulea TaxID=47856 RepID=UPI00190508CF|nr:hypothetical protein [Micromonospora veneta]
MTAAPFDADRRAAAVDLIRALCVAAGSEDAVLDVIERHARTVGHDEATRTVAAALIVTYGTCMTSPVALDTRTPTPITIPNNEGAPTP